MSRAFPTFLLALCFAALASAVEPGNTEKDVLATLGKPTITRQTTNGVIWKFKDGTSVRFEGGVVKEVEGPGSAKDVVRPATEVAAAPVVAAPTPPRAKIPSSSTSAAASPASTSTSTATSADAATSSPPVRLATSPTTTSATSGKVAPAASTRTLYRVPDPPAQSSMRRLSRLALLLVGVLAMVAGNIWLIVVAFKESVGWGIACFFLPVAGLIFIFTHWAATKRIVGLQLLIGLPLVVLGGFVV